jgi:hypothetical protein
MRSFLVVANQTLGGDHLLEKVRECVAAGPCRFHVVVPATPSGEHLTWTEGEAHAIAERRLQRALERFRGLDVEVDGEVGDASPLQAIGDAIRRGQFDEIILSTLPPGVSRWMKLDLPHRVERSFGVPVTHLVGEVDHEPEPPTGPRGDDDGISGDE